MTKVNVIITPKGSILDPHGRAGEAALKSRGYAVERVRVGKFIEVTVPEEDREKAKALVDKFCTELLVNQAMEDYRLEVEE
ncbi:MAG TPA: phosphoribosylformylglycinamidine synthase subunit PurS [Firmicutes bacterium]|jgi:phosphoribosylformylglycinamidine synthase PurS subunit|nr:MAG: phosphoribosylformylglycinamidine synthase [Peptococcaceae bacterium 1109]HHT73676.1 phosphoribosylformylglycinamidine synthase subunit PurS [Bacillota bacterium]